MTASPAPDLTAEQAAIVARFDAAEPAEESVTERLADALAVELDSLGLSGEVSSRASEYLAAVALDVLRGPFPAAPVLPESWEARVETAARAMWDALPATPCGWDGAPEADRATWRRLASAALAAVEPTPEGETTAAVERRERELIARVVEALGRSDLARDYRLGRLAVPLIEEPAR